MATAFQWLARSVSCGCGSGRPVPGRVRQPSRIGGGLGVVDADEHPAGRPINGDEQVAPGRFFSHLRQILDVDMQIAGRIGLERLVLGPGRFRPQIAQIAHPFAIGLEPMALTGSPAQTPVQSRARDIRVEELAQRAIAGAIGSSPMASASRSSIDTSSVLRKTTATASCAGVNVVCSRCGVWLRS